MATTSADPRQGQAAEQTQAQAPPQPEAPRRPTTLLDRVIDATPEFKREVESYEFDLQFARLFQASGLFGDIKGFDPTQAVAAAMTKISLGRTMGFNPAESMQGIELVKGRLSIGAHLRAARMKLHGYSWRFLKHDEKGCSIRLYFQGQPITLEDGSPAIVTYTEADAKMASLIKEDGAYKKNPKNMYFCRAISNAQRWYAPEALGAGTYLPSTEEIVFEDEPAATGKPQGFAPPVRRSETTATAEPEKAEAQSDASEPTEAEMKLWDSLPSDKAK